MPPLIDDWTTFLLMGAAILPGFMVATNADSLPLAVLVFVVLLFSGVFASLLDESSPARKAADEYDRKRREDSRDE